MMNWSKLSELSVLIPSPTNDLDCSGIVYAKQEFRRLSREFRDLFGQAQSLWHEIQKCLSLLAFLRAYSVHDDFHHNLTSATETSVAQFNEVCERFDKAVHDYQQWKTRHYQGPESPHSVQEMRIQLKSSILQTHSLCEFCRRKMQEMGCNSNTSE
jgi:hypothetical protein